MCKSLKATYTFSHKIKLTYSTASKPEKQNNIHGRSSHKKKYVCQHWSAKWVLCKIQCLGD